jgi:hypothetical protein
MRSARLLAVAVLAVLLAVSMFYPVAAQPPAGEITIAKETTNGDHTTKFDFTFTADSDSFSDSFSIPGGEHVTEGQLDPGTYTVVETVPRGWILRSISCIASTPTAIVGSISVASYPSQIDGSSWTVDLVHHSVTIDYALEDIVVCTFTNDPVGPVGGLVEPINTLAVLAPWLAVIGLVGCIGTVAVIAKKRQPHAS